MLQQSPTATPVPKLSPRSVSVASASRRKSRRALLLIEKLQPLLLEFPEFKTILADSIEELRHETSRNPESDNQMVLHAIHCGAWTISDLLEELPTLRRKALERILGELLDGQTIMTAPQPKRSEGGRPPETLYIPVPNIASK